MSKKSQDFNFLFDNIPQAILIFEKDSGKIKEANGTFLNYSGFQLDDLRNEVIFKLVGKGERLRKNVLALNERKSCFSTDFANSDGSKTDYIVEARAAERNGKELIIATFSKATAYQAITSEKKYSDSDQLKRQISSDKVGKIDVICNGFVMTAALKDIFEHQEIESCFYNYPDSLDSELKNLENSEFILFASPEFGSQELEDIRAFSKKYRNIPILTVCLTSCSENSIAMIKSGVRGVICRESDFSLIPHAVDAIMTGELWCPRNVLQQVFENYRIRFSIREEHDGRRLLSERENEILKLIVKGFKNKEIAENLSISYSTVINHTYNIYRKLNVNNRAGAIRFAINNKLVGVL